MAMDYQKEILVQRTLQKKLNQAYQTISWLRLAAVVAVLLGIYLAQSQRLVGISIIAAAVIFFFWCIWQHSRLQSKLRHAACYEEVLQSYEDCMQNKWQQQAQSTPACESTVSEDLDILHGHSLYQYLNMCCHEVGQQALAHALLDAPFNEQEIKERQAAIAELSEKRAFVLGLQTRSRYFHHAPKQSVQARETLLHFTKQSCQARTWHIAAAIFLPLWTLFFLGMAVVGKLPLLGFFVCVMIQVVGLVYSFAVFYPKFAMMRQVQTMLSLYKELLVWVENASFSSSYLQKQQPQKAKEALKKLDTLLSLLYLRSNPLFYILASMFFMYDFWCMYVLDRWFMRYKDLLEDWFTGVGEIEALASLCKLAVCRKQFVFPIVTDSKDIVFEVEGLLHPLLSQDIAKANDICYHALPCLITGSNMSGKTTFLRTIGINLVLAYAGAPVCAKSMRCSRMAIFTSMRVHDNVQEGISTFYGELLRMQEMMRYMEQKRPMLALVDEIFKGTNSVDRIIGATQVIKAMQAKHVALFLSTHDLELCALGEEEPIYAENYHFAEYYKDNRIYFDYLLRQGRSKTSNALYLLRMAGIMR